MSFLTGKPSRYHITSGLGNPLTSTMSLAALPSTAEQCSKGLENFGALAIKNKKQ